MGYIIYNKIYIEIRSNMRHESLPILSKLHKIPRNPEKSTKICAELGCFRAKNRIFVARDK